MSFGENLVITIIGAVVLGVIIIVAAVVHAILSHKE